MPSFIRFLALAGLLLFPGLWLEVCGQESNKQRPRRVAAGPEQSSSTTMSQSKTESQPQEVDQGDVVRVETQMVSVPAVVTNKSGRPLIGLGAENFALFENGEQQKITNFATTEAPFEIALLLDTSGSTRADVVLIRRAANAFIDALRPGDRIAILAFNTDPKTPDKMATVEVLAQLTADRKILRKAVENLGSSNGTPFYDS